MRINIIEYIPNGEENAVSMSELSRLLGVSERDIRKAVFSARKAGAIIAGTQSGYFRPITNVELLEYYHTAKARGISTLTSLKATRAEIKKRGLLRKGRHE